MFKIPVYPGVNTPRLFSFAHTRSVRALVFWRNSMVDPLSRTTINRCDRNYTRVNHAVDGNRLPSWPRRYACLGLFYRWDFNFCLALIRPDPLHPSGYLHFIRSTNRGAGLSILNSRRGCWLKFWDDSKIGRDVIAVWGATDDRPSLNLHSASLLYGWESFLEKIPLNVNENGDFKFRDQTTRVVYTNEKWKI